MSFISVLVLIIGETMLNNDFNVLLVGKSFIVPRITETEFFFQVALKKLRS
jgi:hypothetical protein